MTEVVLEYVPGAHLVHPLEPIEEYEPTGQATDGVLEEGTELLGYELLGADDDG